MKITFIGATHEVTGSCYYLEAAGKKFLVDCGMEQGPDYYENQDIPVKGSDLDFVLLTHAHMDHSGNLPAIYAKGFQGPIYATQATCHLCDIMLRDSAHIQMFEAEWRNRKGRRQGKPEFVPAYTMEDAMGVIQNFVPCPYEKTIKPAEGISVRFVDADLVIGDEFSMVDMWLAQQFFKRIGQHTRVVLVGDPNQLPSVGAGNVFYELIHSGMVPVTVLDWIFRQSKDGLIAYNAKFINEGSTKLYYGNDFVFVDSPTQIETARRIQDIYCKEAAERGIENVQILSPFREKGEAASEQLNRAIRERVNPFRSAEEEVKIGSRIFRVHDRVMQTKNTEKVSNGDLGFITGITTNSKGERLVQMDFGGDRKLTYTTEQLAHVDLAYATTIHKAMGSEFETVIIPIVKAHTIMLYRNLLYTAVTRAKKKVILVGHKPILFMAVHRADISKRNTMLGERIHLYCKAYHTERNALPELQQAG